MLASSFSGSTENRVGRFLQHHILRRRPSSISLTPPPCDTSVQKLFTSNALESDCGVLDDTEDDAEDIFNNSGGLVEKAPAHDEDVVKIQTFLRLCAVRLRLRNDCGLDNLRVLESQVLRSVSQWYSPVAFGSPATARHLAAARVIAGFVDRDVIKWLLIRRRSAQPIAARFVAFD